MSGSPKNVSRGTSGRAGAGWEAPPRGSRSAAVSDAPPARKLRRDDGIECIEAAYVSLRRLAHIPGLRPLRNRATRPRVTSKIRVSNSDPKEELCPPHAPLAGLSS